MESFIKNNIGKLGQIGIVLIVISLIVYQIKEDIFHYTDLRPTLVLMFIGTIFLYGIALLMFDYLRGGKAFRSNLEKSFENLIEKDISNIQNELQNAEGFLIKYNLARDEIKELHSKLSELTDTTTIFTSEEKEELKDNLLRHMSCDISTNILNSIEDKYSQEIKNDNQLNTIRQQLEITRSRLNQEIFELGRRGNINLIIGVITTGLAVYILASTVLNKDMAFTAETLISSFVPKLSLSLFIEIFSFFFLKLYKAGLTEIKYFQNELTNVELKFVALENSIRLKEIESVKDVILSFSHTERNFILEKGQNTIETEKLKIESKNTNILLSNLTELFKSIKPSTNS